jgi:hypothetical protein
VGILREELGGLGSSHTTPCGAAVPARPPTRSSHITDPACTAQWARGATRRGTAVVVLVRYQSLRSGPRKPLIYNSLGRIKLGAAHPA